MTFKRKFNQFVGSLIMSFPKFLFASGMVWPSYTILLLKSDQTPLARPLTLLEEALLGSLPLVSAIITSPFGGTIVDKIGRKYSGILTTFCVTVSWTLTLLCTDINLFFIGRFIFGVSAGLLMQVAWSFTAEISEDSIRGFMSSLPAVMYALGALTSIIMGWLSTYYHIIYINIALSIGNAIVMWLIPESPVYLNLIGKEEEALKSLAFYRASSVHDQGVKDEMAILKKNLKDNQFTKQNDGDPEKMALQNPEKDTSTKVTGFAYMRVTPAARWTLFVTSLLITLSTLTGVIAIQVYGGRLFLKAVPSLSPDICAILLGIVLLMGSICGASCTDLFGRKVLLISASTINGICMVLLGVLIKWPFGPIWLIPALILVFSLVFNFGGGVIPYVILAEGFVPEAKGFAQSMMMLWTYVVNFVLLLAFVPAVELIGMDIVFYIFAACAFATAACTYFILPETKGKNPYEIEKLFERIK